MDLLPRLRQQEVRDLYWACFSQSMLTSDYNVASYAELKNSFPYIEQWFLDLDANPNDLLSHLAKLKSTRLGIYFEALWEYYLLNASVADLIAKNHQVMNGKQTLGEFDFIYYCHRRQRVFHLETAVKFYLGVPGLDQVVIESTKQQHAWIGPGCRDRLDIKADALFQRQLPLSSSEQGRKALKQFNISEIEQELCLKGMLFYPTLRNGMSSSPIGHHPQHLRGEWIRLSRFCSIECNQGCWSLLARRQWFSPCQASEAESLLTTQELAKVLEQYFRQANQAPIQIARLKQSDDGWLEDKRYFIVPNGWPVS